MDVGEMKAHLIHKKSQLPKIVMNDSTGNFRARMTPALKIFEVELPPME
jgi:hypothetical protein